ncbi:uncharacterized protein LOC144175627 isoform X2 [Haemaphysalis longicornis]
MSAPRCGECIKARPGQRVVRGPNWGWRDEDGGSHYVGTVVSVCRPETGSGYTTHPVEVHWDTGEGGCYRASCMSQTFDLRLIDASPAGVVFSNITCNFCGTKDVTGTRWKCANCAEYNLCHPCYMSDKHNLEHQFLRYDEPGATGVPVSSRKTSKKFKFYGIFPGAEVQSALPGHDPNDINLFDRNQKTVSQNDYVQVITNCSEMRRLQNVGIGYDLSVERRMRYSGKRGLVLSIASNDWVQIQVEGEQPVLNPGCFIPVHKTPRRAFGRSISTGSKGLGYGLSKMTALHAACLSGEEDVVSALVMAEADLEEPDENGDRAVHYAAGCKQSRILELLLNSGVDIGACNIFGETALHVAIKENSAACALILAKNIRASDVNIQDNVGNTVLHSAILAGMQQEIISLILQLPTVNVAIKNQKGKTPLHIAAVKATPWAAGRYSEQLSALINTKDKNDMALLHREAMNGRHHIAQMLLEQGFTPVDTVGGKELKTALSIAVEGGHRKFVEVLIEAGADLNKKDADGNAPLHISVTRNHCEITELLVAAGADLNKKDADGNAPLHISVTRNHCEITELLVAAGADVNKQDANGNTPLHISLMSRLAVKASKLSSTKAPKLKEIATELENLRHEEIDSSLAVACFFISSGSSLKLKNAQGLNPLNIAATIPVVRTLLKWAPKTRGPPPKEASVQTSAEHDTAGAEGSASSTETTGAPGPSDEEANCRSAKKRPKEEEIDDRHTCAICMERERTVAFLCGHGACQECATKIKRCHFCRARVKKRIKLYEG